MSFTWSPSISAMPSSPKLLKASSNISRTSTPNFLRKFVVQALLLRPDGSAQVCGFRDFFGPPIRPRSQCRSAQNLRKSGRTQERRPDKDTTEKIHICWDLCAKKVSDETDELLSILKRVSTLEIKIYFRRIRSRSRILKRILKKKSKKIRIFFESFER